MYINLDELKDEYRDRGFTSLALVPPEIATRWGTAISESMLRGSGKSIDDETPEYGRLYYQIMDAFDCESAVADMLSVYHSLPPLLSAITGEDVVTSPYERSRVCGTRYPAPGGQQGYHFDTNGLTVVMYLSTNSDGGTRMHPLNDKSSTITLLPAAGRILIMQGRKVWHCSEPAVISPKIVSPWNYYLNGDTWRPPGLDEAIYGKQ